MKTRYDLQSFFWLVGALDSPVAEINHNAAQELLTRADRKGVLCRFCHGGGWLKDQPNGDNECPDCAGTGTLYPYEETPCSI